MSKLYDVTGYSKATGWTKTIRVEAPSAGFAECLAAKELHDPYDGLLDVYKVGDEMIIHKKPIDWYIRKLQRGEHFSLAGYSDAEFFCMMGIRKNQHSGLGQILDPKHGKILTEIMQRRQNDPRWMFAIPQCLWTSVSQFRKNPKSPYNIDSWLERNEIQIEGYERDMVTDDLAEAAGLYPFIKQLQQMRVVIIGNRALRDLHFLNYKKHFRISSPNLHMEEDGIKNVVWEAMSYRKPAVYLISAGVSAASIIDNLHDTIPNSWFIDTASIWDAFVGEGRQRTWRAKLYKDPAKLQEWKRRNLYG